MAKWTGKKRNYQQEVVDSIVAELENGTAPWVKQWQGGDSDKNIVTNHVYSGINSLILWMHSAKFGYTSTLWITANDCKKLGADFSGTKGKWVSLFRPIQCIKKNDDGEVTNSWVNYTTFRVCNVEEIKNLKHKRLDEQKASVKTTNERNLDFARDVAKTGDKIITGGNQPCYSVTQDVIRMPELSAFTSGEHYDATLAHELTHWSGAKTRLDRFENKRTRKCYAFEELIAELGSAFSARKYGISGDLRHASYIASWIKLLKDDPKALFSAASLASKAVEFLFPQEASDEVAEAA